jgi:hypothetical protein
MGVTGDRLVHWPDSADELGAGVGRWATAVWEAWPAHHGAIRERTAAELARR